MTKKELNNLLQSKGIKAWQLADMLGISESYYTKKIRYIETDIELQAQIKSVLKGV